MPQLNLQQILNGDTIIQLIDKVNENFNQITAIGGGPQGRRGEQGPPGLPGLRGLIGDSGDNGENGPQVTLVGTDPDWPTLYAGSPLGPTDANLAINLGYEVGDIWIDNAVGVFYVIQETLPGAYEFIPFPISVSALSADLWIPDSDSNLSTNDEYQGIRNNNRFITLSLTSLIAPTFTIAGESSNYADTAVNYINLTPTVSGYQRKAYKLSLDNTSENSLNFVERIDDGFISIGPVHYFATNASLAPLIYLGDSSDTSNSKSAFGLLIKSFEPNVGETAGILTLTSGNQINGIFDQFYIDVPKVGIKNEIYFRGKNNEDSYLRWIDVQNDGTYTNSNNSLWLAIGSQTIANQPPTASNPHFNQFGIELRRYKSVNPSFSGGIVNFSGFDGSSLVHTMTISQSGSLFIGNTAPLASGLAAQDDDGDARLIVFQKNSEDAIKLIANVDHSPNMLRLIGPNPTNTWGIGIQGIGVDRFAVRDNNSAAERFTILQNGNTGIDNTLPSAKLHIGGDLKINTVDNLTGDFLTWNDVGGNAKSVRRRTPTEVRLDIEAVGGTGVATQVAFWDTTNTITGDPNLFWDSTNGRLGIGINAPLDGLHIDNRDIRLSGTGTREIKSTLPLKISTLNNNNGIEISTKSSVVETNLPNISGRLVLRGGGNSEQAAAGGVLIYTPDNALSNSPVLGNINIRPGQSGAQSFSGAYTPSRIILERRVQILDNDRQNSSAINIQVEGSGLSGQYYLRATTPFNTAANNIDDFNASTVSTPPTGFIFTEATFDRLVTIEFSVGWSNKNNFYRFSVELDGNTWVPLLTASRSTVTTSTLQTYNCLIPAGCRFAIAVGFPNGTTLSSTTYSVRWIRFGRQDGGFLIGSQN